MTPGSPRFALVPADQLRPHEEVEPAAVKRLAEEIKGDGVVQSPVVVDAGSKVILDGHHRFAALDRLGCKLVPCHLVDYADPSIRVERWSDGRPMSKDELVARALTGELYPQKTSRHQRLAALPDDPTDLRKLRPREGER